MEKQTAIHEAGHAVMGFVIRKRSGRDLISVSIVPDGDTLGRFISHRSETFDPYMSDAEEVEEKLISDLLISLAGGVAESIAIGEFPSEGAEKDLESALDVAMALTDSPAAAEKFIETAMWQTDTILRKNWSAVQQLGNSLLERHTLNGEEIALIIVEALKTTAQ